MPEKEIKPLTDPKERILSATEIEDFISRLFQSDAPSTLEELYLLFDDEFDRTQVPKVADNSLMVALSRQANIKILDLLISEPDFIPIEGFRSIFDLLSNGSIDFVKLQEYLTTLFHKGLFEELDGLSNRHPKTYALLLELNEGSTVFFNKKY